MSTEWDLREPLTTAIVHCWAGGVALFAPDHLRQNFAEGSEKVFVASRP